jgi:hypothetical protein
VHRYFIVIDDIWEKQCWVTLKLAIADDKNCEGRIIITTRKWELAKDASCQHFFLIAQGNYSIQEYMVIKTSVLEKFEVSNGPRRVTGRATRAAFHPPDRRRRLPTSPSPEWPQMEAWQQLQACLKGG